MACRVCSPEINLYDKPFSEHSLEIALQAAYEHVSLIITTNLNLGRWLQVFSNVKIATTLLARVTLCIFMPIQQALPSKLTSFRFSLLHLFAMLLFMLASLVTP
jgi:hypothetical protein